VTWTYNLADLATSEKDQIRMEISDTDPANQLLQDEEIAQAITVETNFWGATARCSEIISRQFLRKADVKLGRAMQLTYTKMAEQYLQMAVKLRQKALGSVVPWVGGMSVSDKVLYLSDPNIVAALFQKTGGENPWTGGYTADALTPVGNAGGSLNGVDEEEIE
jgi:hypothetical protein